MTKSEIMTRAWEIRKAENTTMSVALRKAWAESRKPAHVELAEILGGNVWENYGKTRVYLHKGFVEVTADGWNIDKVKRAQFEEVKAFAASKNIKTFRAA